MSRTLRIFCVAVVLAVFTAGVHAQPDTLVIVHVNDSHSHVTPYGRKDAQGIGTLGGMARAASVIGQTQAMYENALLIHAGDVFIGDLMFNKYFGVAELQLLLQLGLDAFTLGNHEFDLGPDVLKYVIMQAGLPGSGCDVLSGNLDTSEDPEMGALVLPYTIKQLGNIRVGIFGLTTEDTNDFSQPSPDVLTPYVEAAQAAVHALRPQCDVVIGLTHLGLASDQVLAASVPGIDVVVGGHSHDVTASPVAVTNPEGRDTWIVQAGEFYSHVGALVLEVGYGVVHVLDYHMTRIDNSVPEVPEIAAAVEMLVAGIEADPRYGPVYTEVIAEACCDIARPPLSGGTGYKDTPLGNLVADAFRDATGTDVAITVWGFISEQLWAGPLTGADIFRTVPYGYDQSSGLDFPLVTFELSGWDLFIGLETALRGAQLNGMSDLWPQVSNMKVEYAVKSEPWIHLDRLKVGNEVIDLGATYTVTSNLGIYMLLPVLAPSIQPQNVQFTGITECEALRDFIVANSPVCSYAEGRVHQGPAHATPHALGDGQPMTLMLLPNEPNPFRQTTALSYVVPKDGRVSLEIYALTGRKIATVVDEWQTSGTKVIEWSAASAPSGTYIQKLTCGNRSVSLPMTLLR